MSGWIALIDKQPENLQKVLCCDIYNSFVSFGRYREEENEFDLMDLDDGLSIDYDTEITHWMNIPELPIHDEDYLVKD